MNIHFRFSEQSKLKEVLPACFDILYSNMSLIAPTGNTQDEDYRIWLTNMIPTMQGEQCETVLIYEETKMVGYFRYHISGSLFVMEDIQFQKAYQGRGMLSLLFTWLIPQLPAELLTVEAFSHKNNQRVHGILAHLGLKNCGENKNGISYHFQGNYGVLKEKYNTL